MNYIKKIEQILAIILKHGYIIRFIKNHIEKEQKILIEGRIGYQSWEDENGITRYSRKDYLSDSGIDI